MVTLKLTVWELRGKKQDHYQSTTTADYTSLQFDSDFVYLVLQAVLLLLLNDAHYKSDCILLAIFREMLNKSYFKLLAYVPTLPRLLVLHKTLQRFLWNIVNITEIQERCSAAWGVRCTNDAGFALTTSRGTRQVVRVSFTAKSYRFVSIFSYLYQCIVSYTKYRDAPIYRCIVSPLPIPQRHNYLLRVFPPFLPVLCIVGSYWYVPDWRIIPHIEYLGEETTYITSSSAIVMIFHWKPWFWTAPLFAPHSPYRCTLPVVLVSPISGRVICTVLSSHPWSMPLWLPSCCQTRPPHQNFCLGASQAVAPAGEKNGNNYNSTHIEDNFCNPVLRLWQHKICPPHLNTSVHGRGLSCKHMRLTFRFTLPAVAPCKGTVESHTCY